MFFYLLHVSFEFFGQVCQELHRLEVRPECRKVWDNVFKKKEGKRKRVILFPGNFLLL